MHNDEGIQKSVEMLRMVIPRLSKLKLPVTPLNYSLWYEYYSGNNEVVVSKIDELLESEHGWSDEVAKGLYQSLVLRENVGDLDVVTNGVHNLLGRVLDLVSDVGGDVEDFGVSLRGASESLSENSVSELGDLVSSLIDQTEVMMTSNKQVQERLVSTTEEVEQLKNDLEVVKREAMLDPLTGIANRSVLDREMNETLLQVINGSTAFVLMVDVDHFKALNDKYGHLVGDKVLKFLAGTLTDGVKGSDTVARFGGEEFCVILRNIDQKGALSVSESLRRLIQEADLKRSETGESLGRVTVSIGVTCMRATDTIDDVIGRADDALYTSKKQGRNRVTVSGLGDA